MNNFYLICKNWFKSLKKMKGAFITFIALNFLLGIAFSIFLETNNQLNQQIKKLNLDVDEEKFKNQLAFEDVERKVEKKNFYHLFCTDYFQINFNKIEKEKEKIIESEWKDQLITRRPLLTFGSEDGCFENIDYLEINKIIKNVDLYSKINEKKTFFNGFDLNIEDIDTKKIFYQKLKKDNKKLSEIYFPLKLNKKSKYYQNSIHGRLIQKYQKTKNLKYLTWAKKIEEHFFPRIARFIYKKIIIALSDFFSNRYVTKINKYENLNLKEILEEIKRKKESNEIISEHENSLNEKILNDLNENKKSILEKNIVDEEIKNLKQDLFVTKFSENKNLIDKFIKEITSFYENYYLEDQISEIIKILDQNEEEKIKTKDDRYIIVKQKISIIENTLASISERLRQANKIKMQFNLKEKFFFKFDYPDQNSDNKDILYIPEINFEEKRKTDYDLISPLTIIKQIKTDKWTKILPTNNQNLEVGINFKNFIEILENSSFVFNKNSIIFITSLFESALKGLDKIWELLSQKLPFIQELTKKENKFNIFNYLDFDFWNQEKNINKIFKNLEVQNIEKIKIIATFYKMIKTFDFFNKNEKKNWSSSFFENDKNSLSTNIVSTTQASANEEETNIEQTSIETYEDLKSEIFDESFDWSIPKMIQYIYENDFKNFDKYSEKYLKLTEKIYSNLFKNIEIKNKDEIIQLKVNSKIERIKFRNIFLEENFEKIKENKSWIWTQIISIILKQKIENLETDDQQKIKKYFDSLEQKNNYHQIYQKYNHFNEDIWSISKILKIDQINTMEQKERYKTLETLEKKIIEIPDQEMIFEQNSFWYIQKKYSKIFNLFFINQTKINNYQKKEKEITIKDLTTFNQNNIEKFLPNSWQGKNDNFEIQNNKNWFNYLKLSISKNKIVFQKNKFNPFDETVLEKGYPETIVENEKNNLLLQKIFTNLNNFDINFILGYVINDPKKEETNFIMQQNEEVQFQIISGRKAILENEVVISPTTARNKNLKVGDKIDFLNIKNFIISGIGNQKEFIFPIFAAEKFIPKKNDGIYYLTKKSYFENFKVSYLTHTKKNYNIVRHSLGILKHNNDDKYLENDLKNLKLISGKNEKNNLTISSFFYNKDRKKKDKEKYQSKNSSIFKDLKVEKIKNLQSIPITRNFDVLKIHQKYIKYSTIGIIVFFAMMISFVTYYTINKKIEINRPQLGLLKGIGIKNYTIWFALLPLILIIFLSIFCGWFVGIFLQLINFETFERFLNLNFERYNFDFINLLISFLITVFIAFTTVFIYEKSKFKKMSAYVLLKKIDKKSKFSFNFNFNFMKKKISFKKTPKLKINFLFFKIFWKKMLFLFFVFVIIFFNIIGIVKILTIHDETIEQQYKNINYTIQLKHEQPTRGMPFSYQRILLSEGLAGIKKSKFAPIDKWRNDVYFKNENQEFINYETTDIVNEVIPLFRPVIGKTINYNWVFDLLEKTFEKNNDQKNTQKFLCEIFETETKNIKENCIDDVIENYIPILFEGEDGDTIKKHFPVSSNVINFNDQTDELFTFSEVKTKNNKKFSLFGLNENTDVFKFKEKSKKEVFNLQNNGQNGEIKVISNTNFLLKYNLKVHEKIKLQYLKKEIVYQPNENIKQIIKLKDWYYQKNGKGEKIPVTKLRDDVKFYRGWELSERLKGKIKNKNDIYYLGQAKEGETENYFPWIDIADIYVELNEKKIQPFKSIEGETEIVPGNPQIGKPISWFARQIRDQKLKIIETWKDFENNNGQKITFKIIDNIETYFEPRLFLEQGVLNNLIGFNQKKTYKNQYKWFNGRFSKNSNILNAIFIINLYNDFGYSDFDVISVLANKGRRGHIENFQTIDFIKKILNDFADYFFRVNFFIFFFNFLLIVFLFIWVIKITLRYLRDIVMNLKMFGYNWKIILFQIFQTFFIPFIIAFFAGIFITDLILKFFINTIAQYNFYLFVSNEIWIFIVVFLFLAFILLLIIRSFYKNIKKTNLSTFFKNE